MASVLNINIVHSGMTHSVEIAAACTLAELRNDIYNVIGVEPEQQTALIWKGKTVNTATDQLMLVRDLGLRDNFNVKVIGTPIDAIKSMRADESSALRRHEARKRARELRPLYSSAKSGPGPSKYTFGKLEVLENVPEGAPPASKAMSFLQRIKDDRGIREIMAKHEWSVGKLTEFAPSLETGLVGVTGGCLLGFNKNKGQEISLRLRTDDFAGFRHYRIIIETVLHELAHMVHSEHETPFWTLNSQLKREYIELDWAKSNGRQVGGVSAGWSENYWNESQSKVEPIVRKLGSDGAPTHLNVREAAADAAQTRAAVNLLSTAGGVSGEENSDINCNCDHHHEHKHKEGHTCEDDSGKMTAELETKNISSESTSSEAVNLIRDDGVMPDVTSMEVEVPKKLEDPQNISTEAKNQLNIAVQQLKDMGCSEKELSLGLSAQKVATSVESVTILSKIIFNLRSKPDEPKYKQIRLENAKFRKAIRSCYQEAVEFLKDLGFSESSDKSTLIYSRNDPGLLWLAGSLLETLLQPSLSS